MTDDTSDGGVTKLFDKGLALAGLQTQVAAYEKNIGPLTALGRTTDNSAATYKQGRRPKPAVELRAGSTVPDGYKKVCTGHVWILGEPQDVIAVRKNAA
jgi:hypothetical protein